MRKENQLRRMKQTDTVGADRCGIRSLSLMDLNSQVPPGLDLKVASLLAIED